MENTVGLVLKESKFSIPNNWLLFSIPNFLYCTFSFELVQAAVNFPESVQSSVRISTGANHQLKKCVGLAVMGIQTRFISLACDTLDERVHADVIAEHIVKRQVQETR